MDRAAFYVEVTRNIGSFSNEAKQGFEIILGEAEARATNTNDLAYMLATAWWETAKTMQPVREAFFVAPNDFDKAEKWRRKNLHYYPYYGRGYVQLTWKDNYKKASKELNEDFVAKPDGVMEPSRAVKIMFDGMEKGWFTGRSLDDYIDEIDESDNEDIKEYIEARRIVNGSDKAKAIAEIALSFESALRVSGYASSSLSFLSSSVPHSTLNISEFESYIASLGLRHFKPYEFLEKGGQHRNPDSSAFGLNTDPPKDLWSNIKATAKILDKLRERLERPIVMSSVYRSPAYNAAIGGAGQSLHVSFNAVDFSVRGSPVGPSEWAAPLREMRSAGLFEGGIGIYSTFVHVDTRGQNVDWFG